MNRIAIAVMCLAGILYGADGIVRRLVSTCETSDPVDRNWAVSYGETFDMEVRFLDHGAPMDLAGSSIVLHARTNGMAEGWSYQTTGSVMSATGWATVRCEVDRVLPQGLSSATYVLAATVFGRTNLLTATGAFRISGTGAGINGAAVPSYMAADLRAQISNVLAVARAAGDSYTMLDSSDTNLFLRMEHGTNWVYSSADGTQRVGRVVLVDEFTNLQARVDSVTIPSNTVGWLLWDNGSNEWMRVTASNYCLFFGRSDYQPGAPLVTTNGLATPSDLAGATNGLARWSDVLVLTNGLIGASVTNGLLSASALASYARLADLYSATSGLALASVLSDYALVSDLPALTNGLATAASLTSATTGLATASAVIGSTNGLARLVDVQAATTGLARVTVTNGLVSSSALTNYQPLATVSALTNNLASVSFVSGSIAAATTGLATASALIGATNGLARLVDVQAATTGLARVTVTNGLVSSSALTNYQPLATVSALTNNLASVSFVSGSIATATTGLAMASELIGATNGLARLVDVQAATTGLARVTATNGLVSSSALTNYQPLATVSALTNGLVGASVTNGLLAAAWTNQAVNNAALVAATAGVLRVESDTLSSVAARGDFAGTETISPSVVRARIYGPTNTALNAAGDNWMAFGGGAQAAGDCWTALGWHAGDAASWSYSIALGPWAGRNGTRNGSVHIGAYASDPGDLHDPNNDTFVYHADDRSTLIGVTNGTVTLRGTFSLQSLAATNATITNLVVKSLTFGGLTTNGWPAIASDPTITNGLATWASVVSATTGLVRASVTNGLVGSSVTNGLASWASVVSATGSISISSSITNGLASTNYVASWISALNAITPPQVTNIVQSLVEGAVGVTPSSVTNMTSILLFSATNSNGYTTQQVWRVGGSVATNFFSRAGETGTQSTCFVYSVWSRPSYWPVGSGYDVEAWQTPESNICKMVVCAQTGSRQFALIDTVSGNSVVDWGDGIIETNADLTYISHNYTNRVSYSPVIITASAGFSRIYIGNYATSDKQVEIILPAEIATVSDAAFYNNDTVVSFVGNLRSIGVASAFEGCAQLEHISLPILTNTFPAVYDSTFKNCTRLRSASLPKLETFGWAAFYGCANLIELDISSARALYGEAAFYGCSRLCQLSPMTNLTSATTRNNYSTFDLTSLGFIAITNFIYQLPTASVSSCLSFKSCPGSADASAWFVGAVSDAFAAKNWSFQFQ